MRSGGTSTILLAVLLAAVRPAGAAGSVSVSARAAIVMDAATGDVLWERNASQPLPPASTTKVLTAILALESGRLDETFRVSASAAETAPSKINLRAGQRMRLKNLVYALLLNSANDAAEVIAEGLAGSEDEFSARMNERARELGATTAHFANPHGLTARGHSASARDLALIFRHGLQLPVFREILETRSAQVPVEATGVQWVSLRSHNRLLSGYTYLVIGKTGFTRPARRCFVGAATHDGRELIIAVLGARDLWSDAKKLFTYGFGAAADRPSLVMAGIMPLPALAGPEPARSPEVEEDDTEVPRYAVRLGPYASRRVALTTRARLARRGYTAVLAGRTLRIGSFSTASRAGRVAGRLRQSGYRPIVVQL